MRKLERMAYRNARKAARLHAPHISKNTAHLGMASDVMALSSLYCTETLCLDDFLD